MLYALVVLCFLNNVLARVKFEEGPCPEMEVMQNFDVSKYVGRWYDVLHVVRRSRDNKKCITHHIELDSSLGIISEIVSCIYRATGVLAYRPMELRIVDHDEAAKMTRKPLGSIYTDKYWILDTDYSSYALVYSCHGDNIQHGKEVIFLSRNKIIPEATLTKFTALMEKYNLNGLDFATVKQTECVLRPSK